MKKIILMIVVAVLIVGVSGGGVYLWQTKFNQKTCVQNQTKPEVTNINQTATTTDGDIPVSALINDNNWNAIGDKFNHDGWSEYTNTKYGYSFKYPVNYMVLDAKSGQNTWEMKDISQNGGSEDSVIFISREDLQKQKDNYNICNGNGDKSKCQYEGPVGSSIGIDIIKNASDQSLWDWFRNNTTSTPVDLLSRAIIHGNDHDNMISFLEYFYPAYAVVGHDAYVELAKDDNILQFSGSGLSQEDFYSILETLTLPK